MAEVGLTELNEIIAESANTHTLTKTQIISILKDDSINEFLFKTADSVRQKYVGNEIHLRGLIEFSNICRCNCFYCGLRKDNLSVSRYRMSFEEVLHLANVAKTLDYKTVVLQSGEDAFFSADKMCEIIEAIKKLDLAVTLSLGEKTFEEYKLYKDAGADRYLLRIETTDKELYESLHPNMSFENRVKCLENLKEIGFETGTGCLVGLPNQSIESLADDILFFKNIDADMVGLGPFIPCPKTPLQDTKIGNLYLALKVMAITRILLPDINIPATTAMETIQSNGRVLALQSGANVVMPNVTSDECKQKYSIYPGKSGEHASVEDYKKFLFEKFSSIGRTVSGDFGFRIKK